MSCKKYLENSNFFLLVVSVARWSDLRLKLSDWIPLERSKTMFYFLICSNFECVPFRIYLFITFYPCSRKRRREAAIWSLFIRGSSISLTNPRLRVFQVWSQVMRSPVRRVRQRALRISQHINHQSVTLTRNLRGYVSHFRRWALPVLPDPFSPSSGKAFFLALIMVMHMSKRPSSVPPQRSRLPDEFFL